MNKLWTVRSLLQVSTDYLQEQGCDNPRLDAELLLGQAIGLERLQIYLNLDRPLEKEEVDCYRKLVGLRGRRLPLAYLTGEKEFFSRIFQVNEQVLIPRPETELLVEEAISLAGNWSQPCILDLGTGSGIIAVMLALQVPDARITAVDISPEALQVARENARRCQVEARIDFGQSDLFAAVPRQPFQLICSNPPYIPTAELMRLAAEVQKEPQLALDGGPDGLSYYRRIIPEARDYLCSGGFLLLEIGHDQAASVIALSEDNQFQLHKLIKDYSRHDRVVILRWS